jgi:archaellum component FlaC
VPATLREFTVVLEKIYTDYKVFGESLDGLRTQFGGLQTQFGGLSARFDRLETRMEAGFAQVDARFERVENDVSALKRDTELIKVAVMTHSRELKELHRDVTDLAAKKVDRDEVEGIVKRVVGSAAR